MPASPPSRSGDPEDSFPQSLTAPHGLKEDSVRPALEDPPPPRLRSPPQTLSEEKIPTAQRRKLRTRAGDVSHFIPELLWVALLGGEGLRPGLEGSHLLKVL